MKMTTNRLPITGDFSAFRTDIWEKGKIRFSLIAKLSRTELRVALNKKCVESKKEALAKLRGFSRSRATDVYNSGEFKDGEIRTIPYSPCWQYLSYLLSNKTNLLIFVILAQFTV